MSSLIGVFNAGSSTLKFSFFNADTLERSYGGVFDHGTHAPQFLWHDAQGKNCITHDIQEEKPETLIPFLLKTLKDYAPNQPLVAVGHRVVHGKDASHPVRITPQVLHDLNALIPLAPLHQPYALKVIDAITAHYPQLPQMACFDTAFHQTQSSQERRLPLARRLYDQGLKRYGYHGLSYAYIVSHALPALMGDRTDGRIIIAHLGSGASACAVHQRHSIATTMGFSPLDGLMMGTRPGSLDPGVLLYMMQNLNMTAQDIEQSLYYESGLLGVSSFSSDMRALLENNSLEAKEAVELFCKIAAQNISHLMVSLSGLDALVFTGGIGENSPIIRQCIADHLEWANLSLDSERNATQETWIQKEGSRIPILRIPTHEDVMIAQACKTLL